MKHTEIKVEKICRNMYVAKCMMYEGKTQMEIKMQGHSEDVARKKLELCLTGEPYSHLDKK